MDWNAAIARKYDILQQQADADALRAKGAFTSDTASAALDTTRAGLMPKESASQIGLQGAQAGLLGAQTNAANVDARLAPSLARASIYQQTGAGMQYRAGTQGELYKINPGSPAEQLKAFQDMGVDISDYSKNPGKYASLFKDKYTVRDPGIGTPSIDIPSIATPGMPASNKRRMRSNVTGMPYTEERRGDGPTIYEIP